MGGHVVQREVRLVVPKRWEPRLHWPNIGIWLALAGRRWPGNLFLHLHWPNVAPTVGPTLSKQQNDIGPTSFANVGPTSKCNLGVVFKCNYFMLMENIPCSIDCFLCLSCVTCCNHKHCKTESSLSIGSYKENHQCTIDQHILSLIQFRWFRRILYMCINYR